MRSATIVLVLILSAVLPSPAGAAWVSSVAATTVLTGPGQLALLPSGRAAVAYAASSLVYQEETASGFVRTVIDESCINSFSISVDASGEPAIAYCSVGELRFAHRVAGTFLIDRPEGATTKCASVSLAHDPSGRPGIAYHGSGGLRYLGFNGTAWDAAAVSSIDGIDSSLGFSSTGAPAIAFKFVSRLPRDERRRVQQSLYLATRPSAAWSVADIAKVYSGFLTSPSLAFNALDEPAVAYAMGSTCQKTIRVYEPTGTSIVGPTSCSRVSLARTPGGDLVVAHERIAGTIALESRTGSTWLQEDVRTDAREPRLVIDTAATPRVLAITMDSRVELSTRNGSWSTVVVDVDGSALLSPSLAVSGTLPAVSFGTGSDTLEVSRFDGASWTREIIDASAGSGYGESSMAAFPASPLLGIAYSLPASVNNGAIRYAQSDGLSVSVEEIVPSGAQRYVSLALDGAGHPAIAYSLTGSGALQLARFDGTLWSSSQVSSLSAGAVSLAFDPTGQPAIAYHETTGADLRFALFDGTTWTDTAVAVTGTVGLKPSLAFDPAGRASIAYFDQTAAVVMLAEDDGSGFVTTTVQSGVPAIGSIDLVLGPGAVRQIAIASLGRLNVARGVPVAASESADELARGFTIEPVAVSALAAEIALDAQGRTYMAYAAECRGRIVVATEAAAVTLFLLRKRLADVLPRWKLAAFPLTTTNDDGEPPFPLAVQGPGSSLDPIAPGAEPLVLYTDMDSSASANVLRLAKSGSGVRIAY